MSAKIPQPMAPWPGHNQGDSTHTPHLVMQHREIRDLVLGDCPQWLNLWQGKAPIIEVIRKDTVFAEAGPLPVLSPGRAWAWVCGGPQN